MSRRKNNKKLDGEEEAEIVIEALDKAEWNPKLFRVFFGSTRCFKCGAVDYSFDEIIDEDEGLVLQCARCPEAHEHN